MQPHKSEYWLFPKETGTEEFKERVSKISELYIDIAKDVADKNTNYYSSDEKTGVQAISRASAKSMTKGYIEKVESEYQRNGTQCLIASKDLKTGKIVEYSIGQTRTEEDYLTHIQNIVKLNPQENTVIFCDQLNTHKSESLVNWIAQTIGYTGELGIKGKVGILESQKTRQAFLEDESHKIRFLYTPKHCSWINQIENWFGILQKKVIKRGNFPSTENLKQKMIDFIIYYNKCMAKPFRWKSKCEKIIMSLMI